MSMMLVILQAHKRDEQNAPVPVENGAYGSDEFMSRNLSMMLLFPNRSEAGYKSCL